MNTKDIIDKLELTKKLVVMGKNGVGKTYQLKEIQKNINDKNFDKESSLIKINPIYIGYDLDKEFNEIIFNLLDNAFYSKSPTKYQKLKDLILEGYSNINDFFTKFDNVISEYKYDEIKSTHIIKTIDNSVSKSNININYDYDNGRGNDYYLKLKILVELTELINKQVLEDFQKRKNELINKKIILLIDEPEKYCFPGLIIKLATFLSNSDTEIICTSHSPIFVNAYINNFEDLIFIKSREEIINFTSDELISFCHNSYKTELKGKTYRAKKQLFTDKKRFEKYFESILKKEIIECLYNDVVIIVEGATDKQLINFILNDKKTELMFSSYIVQTNGKDIFPIYLSILKQYKVSIFSLFDLDKDSSETHRIYNDFIKSNSSVFYYFENNIETTFELEEESTGEKVHVGPTNMLITLLDNRASFDTIIDEIALKLEFCHIENIVGEENIKNEIRRISTELNKTDIPEDEVENDIIDKYIVLHKLIKKYYKQYGQVINNLNFEKEVKLSHSYIHNNRKLTNISHNNFRKIIQKYKNNQIFENEFLELIFGIYLYESKKQDQAYNLLKPEYSLHNNILNTFESYKVSEESEIDFLKYIEKEVNEILLEIEKDFKLYDYKLVDLQSYDKLREHSIKSVIEKNYENRGLNFKERKDIVDRALSKYTSELYNILG